MLVSLSLIRQDFSNRVFWCCGMVVDDRLTSLCEQAIASHSSRLCDWQSLATEVQCLLGWESNSYILQVLSGQQPVTSISDRQWLYWAVGILLQGNWESHCRYQPPTVLGKAA